jgi:hypothetical protein
MESTWSLDLTEEFAALLPTKEAIVLVGADLGLYDEVKNMLRSVGIQIEKVAGLVTGGVPSMAWMEQLRDFFYHQPPEENNAIAIWLYAIVSYQEDMHQCEIS